MTPQTQEPTTQGLGHRKLTGPEVAGLWADIARDFRGTVAAFRNATPEVNERREQIAEHVMHRVELHRADGSVAARGELMSVTVCGAHLMFVEDGEKFVPLADIHEVVRLQPVREMQAYVRDAAAKQHRTAGTEAGL